MIKIEENIHLISYSTLFSKCNCMGVANKSSQNKHRQLERQTVGQTDNTTPTHAVPECGQCPPSLQVPATNVNQLRLETIINANCGFICTQTKHTHTCTHTYSHRGNRTCSGGIAKV